MPIDYGSNDVASSGNINVSGIVTATSGIFSNLTVGGSSFNIAVSGLLPIIANSGDNRILTSTGTSTGINAETNLTFDGTNLNVSGVFNIDNIRIEDNTISSTNSNGNIIISPNGSGNVQVSGTLIATSGSITILTTVPTFVSPSSLSSNQGDWDPGAGDIIRMTASTGISISGIVPHNEYTRVLINIGSTHKITLKHQATSATSGNRIITSIGGDHIIPPTGSVTILYDTVDTRWRVL